MPNIIVVSVDDLASWVGPFGVLSETIHTPNIDRLVARGITFENAYASEPVCNPSRAATLSGRDPQTTGVHSNWQVWHEFIDASDTYPAQFTAAGWDVLSFGKIVHGGLPQDLRDVMFTEFAPIAGFENGGAGVPPAAPLPASIDADQLADSITVDRALAYLESADPRTPYLLNVGLVKPHLDWIVPQEYFDLYPLDEIVVPGLVGNDMSQVPAFIVEQIGAATGHPLPRDVEAAKVFVQGYLASLSYADAQLGRLLDALEAQGTLTDTNIVLWSDHGYHFGDRDGYWGKFTLWEEAASVPLIIKPAGEARAGIVVSDVVSLLDIYPTLIEMGGLAPVSGLDGDSLMPLVTGDGPANGDGMALTWMYGSAALRSDRYTFIRYEDGSEELYDMVEDRRQTVNLALDPAYDGVRDAQRADLESKAGILPGTPGTTGTDAGDLFFLTDAGTTVAGGDGDDRYYVQASDAVIVERPGGGYDIAHVSVDYALPDHVESLLSTGSFVPDALVLAGNGLDNILTGSPVDETISGGLGDDTIRGGNGDDVLLGEGGDDVITGGVHRTHIDGGSGNDTLRGGHQETTLIGGSGADLIYAGRGATTMQGGTGDDVLVASAGGAKIMDGGPGADALYGNGDLATASYASATGAVTADLARPGTNRGDADGDVYHAILRLFGSGFDDRLSGDAAANVIDGGDGDDVLSGRDGDDVLQGGAGDDTLIGGAGGDSLSGGAGFDIAAYTDATGAVIADLIGQDGGLDVPGSGDRFDGIEGLQGGAWADSLFGNARANLIAGALGDDRLFGRGGSDTLSGDLGDDRLNGGVGADLILGGQGQDTLIGLEGFDRLVGQAGADSLEGNAGADTLLGGGGADTLVGGINFDLLSGGAGDDLLRGMDGYDTLNGNAGDDRLEGNAGSDRLDGGQGDDTLFGGLGADTFLLRTGGGADVIMDFQRVDRIRIDAAFVEDGRLIDDYVTATPFGAVVDFGAAGSLTVIGPLSHVAIIDAIDLI